MKFNEKAPRYQAGHVELREGVGPVTRMCPIGDFLEVYKVDRTFRIYAPESLDPNETNPNMSWTATCTSKVGSGNLIVSRVFIQPHEALKDVTLKKGIDKKDIIKQLHRSKELLLSAESAYEDIVSQRNYWEGKLSSGEIKKKGNIYIPFPIIENLVSNVSVFLSNTKNFIQTHTDIFNEFYHTSFNGPRFDVIIKWCKKNLSAEDGFIRFLEEQNGILKYITDLRNAQEHPKEDSYLTIENFKLTPDNQICTPRWFLSAENPTDICLDMQAIIRFLIEFSEVFILFCLSANLNTWLPYRVLEISEKNRDAVCPIRFVLEIDPDEVMKRIKK